MSDLSFSILRRLPRNALSRTVGVATRAPLPRAFHRLAIRWFVRRYGVDATESEHDVLSYPTFAAFFTRRLKPGLRPIATGERLPVSPVDGTFGELGVIDDGRLLQAKGRSYTVAELLGGPEADDDALLFRDGSFVTIYLAPHNYHRIHAPLGGTIDGYNYVPGTLWPVNAVGVRSVDKLFCVNERLTTWLTTPAGPCAVVAVGATNVGRIRAMYDTILTNRSGPRSERRVRYPRSTKVTKGAELAVFEMGSTVVLLLASGVQLSSELEAGQSIQLGKALS